MNEFLRVLDRLLKKRGYAIKKHPQYNLLPLESFEKHEALKTVYSTFEDKESPKNNVDAVNVCLRTCLNEKRIKDKQNPITGVNMEVHLLKCVHSLFVSINDAVKKGIEVRLDIFDDRSDEAALEKIKGLANSLGCEWSIITTKQSGQGPSLHEHFSSSRDKNAIFYFCEDDYLHITDAIFEMQQFYKKIYEQTGSHFLIHPQEHELIYTQVNYPSYILAGDNRRWRTMSNATHTFLTHASVVDEYWQYFENTKYVGVKEKRHLGSEKKTTDLLFKHIPGFSPIPAVAVHMQTEQSLPPFFDWRKVWNEQNI